MWFIVGNKIRIKEPTESVKSWCKDNLILGNPDYIKKERMGLWTGNTPREFYLYERDGDDLVLPFGCINQLKSMYPDYCFKSAQKTPESFSCSSNIKLYDYQEEALKKALRWRNGVLVMPCGSGKTQVGLEIIARLKLKTLWLTHTQDLLNQSLNRAKSVLNCANSSYGKITGGKVEIGSGITFATVQTMAKLDLSQYKDTWGIVIVDECHHAVGSPTRVMQFYKVLSGLSCRYKFGLTATPNRADGLEKAMFALIGDVLHEVSKEEVSHTTCPVVVKKVYTDYVPDFDVCLSGDGTINYSALVDDLTKNQERFDLVSDVIQKLDGATIVLANRVEYLERLQKRYDELHGGFEPSVCLSVIGNSKSARMLRKNCLKGLQDGDIDCIFATYQLAKEGLDVPNLKYVVFATPEKDETTVMQSAGRVGRKAEGKSFGTVIDFVDSSFGMFNGWFKKRNRVYKKAGYEVCDYGS